MKNWNKKTTAIALTTLITVSTGSLILIKKKSAPVDGESNLSQQPVAITNATNGTYESVNSNAIGSADYSATETKEGCQRIQFRHQDRNQKRDIEEFTYDLNAFSIPDQNPNAKSICVKVNQKPVHHQLKKKGNGTEVWIGSVVGPESEIEITYCTGKNTCKENCKIRSENKVDELLNEEELAEMSDRPLEEKIKELRSIASQHEGLADASVIREWNQTGPQERNCKHN